jgi:ABC-type uncharacterized transport system involved in gliding motility auxiliary subunit/ABC-type transport system involved in multi-copper enzyme maturation permease subunit
MNANVLFAVFRRNFVSYFANPTGYVFICVFVLLSGFAAFWPNDFFNANLANLDQLTRWFPFIMLIFIPAITMGVWAQERAQGTDELLLTIPGSDLGIVAGKYLAAVAIFTVSLLFSLVCNFAVLAWLGDPDRGLFLGTYTGYWCIGLAMLGIGMVASFLTGNLTIAFILAALLNAPLVFAVYADSVAGSVFSADVALAIKQWSIGAQLRDFSQGVVSFSSIAYFVTIVAVSLYLSTVLLGRRHWSSGHLNVSQWAMYPLVVLVWLVVAVLSFGVLLLFEEVLAILIANMHGVFLPQAPWPSVFWLIWLGFWLAVLVGAIAVRQGWTWFPDRVSWMVFHYAGRTAALLVLAVCFNMLCRRQYHFYVGWMPWLHWVVLAAVGLWAVGIAVLLARGRTSWQFWGLFPAFLVLLFVCSGTRIDVSSERLNSLSVPARDLLATMEFPRPVTIEAFVSPTVPETYVQTRMNLLAMLRQLEARFGGQVQVTVNNTERFSKEATRAEAVFGITPHKVPTTDRGVRSEEEIFMGVAVKSGWRKVVVPFIGRGTPLEYELVRSLGTLAKAPDEEQAEESAENGKQTAKSDASKEPVRKRLGVVPTSFPLLSGGPYARLLEELQKQYEVVEVKWDEPITTAQYDVLLIVQPSSLVEGPPPMDMDPAAKKEPKPDHMDQLVAAINGGVPAAIFQDPLPILSPLPLPQPPPQAMSPQQKQQKAMRDMQMRMMGQQPPPDPPEYGKLWKALGIVFPHDQIVWQEYNPYPKIAHFSKNKEFVFLDSASRADFNSADEISSGLQHVLFPFPGCLAKSDTSMLKFQPLVTTGRTKTGLIGQRDILRQTQYGMDIDEQRTYKRQPRSYVLAARIEGENPPVNAVVVADADLFSPWVLNVREQAAGLEEGINFDLDNVTFVLNILDSLAGDDRFVEMRNRRPKHRILTRVEQRTEKAKKATSDAREKCYEDCANNVKRETEGLQARIVALEKELKSRKTVDVQELVNELGAATAEFKSRKDEKQKEYERIRDQEVSKSETELAQQIRRVQDQCKIWAVLLPPIPPLIVAAIVFFTRRVREREGIARSRLR